MHGTRGTLRRDVRGAHVHMSVCHSMCVHVCTCLSQCVCVQVSPSTHEGGMYMGTCIHACVCLCACVQYLYVFMCMCACVCHSVCMCV